MAIHNIHFYLRTAHSFHVFFILDKELKIKKSYVVLSGVMFVTNSIKVNKLVMVLLQGRVWWYHVSLRNKEITFRGAEDETIILFKISSFQIFCFTQKRKIGSGEIRGQI
jgi:hypothetical protein